MPRLNSAPNAGKFVTDDGDEQIDQELMACTRQCRISKDRIRIQFLPNFFFYLDEQHMDRMAMIEMTIPRKVFYSTFPRYISIRDVRINPVVRAEKPAQLFGVHAAQICPVFQRLSV